MIKNKNKSSRDCEASMHPQFYRNPMKRSSVAPPPLNDGDARHVCVAHSRYERVELALLQLQTIEVRVGNVRELSATGAVLLHRQPR